MLIVSFFFIFYKSSDTYLPSVDRDLGLQNLVRQILYFRDF